jgi:DNA-binding winged helix-turn-helix (wHTH) protein
MSAPCLAFGPFLLDQERRVLRCDRNPVAVGQRGIRILAALLHRPGEVLTKAELMDAAWPISPSRSRHCANVSDNRRKAESG